MVTLYLIATNVYSSVHAPTRRGFSYIEIWMIGIQIPILTGVIEYGILLALKKYYQEGCDFYNLGKTIDKWTFIATLSFTIIFNIIYWLHGRTL